MFSIESENDVIDLNSAQLLISIRGGIMRSLLRGKDAEDVGCETVVEIVKLFVSKDLSISLYLQTVLDLIGFEGREMLKKEVNVFVVNCGMGDLPRRIVRHILEY